MGISSSIHISPPNNFNYFALAFGHTDRLRLILAPDCVIQATEALLLKNWKLHDIFKKNNFASFKIESAPWYSTGNKDIKVKCFLCKLLQIFYEYGWHQCATTDLELTGNGKSVVIFEKRESIKVTVLCLSLNESDKIRVVGPKSIYTQIGHVIEGNWPRGLQKKKTLEKCCEFKLKGNPWSMSHESEETMRIVVLINQILSTLYQNGWHFACAIRTDKSFYEVDSLYFISSSDEMDPSNFMAVSINETDRLRFIQPQPEHVKLYKRFAGELWSKGVQKEKSKMPVYYEFKLKGNPWNSENDESIKARELLGDLFQLMYNNNYELYSMLDLTRNLDSKSTIFFRSRPYNSKSPPRYLNVVSMSLHAHDKIRLIRARERVKCFVREAIVKGWPEGIKKESDYYNSWEFKLKGWPFESDPRSQVYITVTLLYILSAFTSNGFRLITSMDVSGKYYSDKNNGYELDLHTWYFEELYKN